MQFGVEQFELKHVLLIRVKFMSQESHVSVLFVVVQVAQFRVVQFVLFVQLTQVLLVRVNPGLQVSHVSFPPLDVQIAHSVIVQF